MPVLEAPVVGATDLVVFLPPAGASLTTDRLFMRGRTSPSNRVTVNGQAVEPDGDGNFFASVRLAAGESTVEITSTDTEGNVARLARTYHVAAFEWFLLALADGAGGIGAKLDGMNAETTREYDNEIYTHGRVVAYFKGRISGEALLASSPVRTAKLTAHIDTGKQAEAELLRQLIDPERYYPVYGDASEEVQDVATRGKVYILLEVDRSRLVFGNFKMSMAGLELFRYERSLYGGAVEVNVEAVPGYRTDVKALIANDDRGIRTQRLVLQGTGGSLFFLKNRSIIEGSERVNIVVRDAVTASSLLSLPQQRDLDFRMDYAEGRLVFFEPVPSTVAAGWQVNRNNMRALEGNPVFVEVSYEYNAADASEGESAIAVHASQTLFDRLTLGGGYVDEDRSKAGAGHYRLYGGDMRLRIGTGTQLAMEVAYSQSADQEHLASFDGGITYAQLAADPVGESTTGPSTGSERLSGWAAMLQLSGTLNELWGGPTLGAPSSSEVRSVPLTDASVAAEAPSEVLIPYALYAQRQDPGFFSGVGVFEQGQTKFGGQLRALLNSCDTLMLRHDSVLSLLYVGTDEVTTQRHLSTFGYEHAELDWKAGFELGNTYTKTGTGKASDAGLGAIFGELKITERLTGLAEQELVVGGNEQLVTSTLDRFATTVGARYLLNDTLSLSATEVVRWSGTNSTQLGLRALVADGLNIYVAERLTAGRGSAVSTTVVGGESTAIAGSRSYAEYQLDSLASGQSGRAIFGMDNRWEILEGLQLNLSYERAQLAGATGTLGVVAGGGMTGRVEAPPQAATGSVINNPQTTGYGSGALTGEQQFSASSYTSAGMFPVGVASRDAFAIGMDYLRQHAFKAGARFELRYDRGDENLGAADRMVFYGMAGAELSLGRDLVALARGQGASVRNMDLDLIDGHFLEGSVGLALRPAHSNRYGALLKWTGRFEHRAVAGLDYLYQHDTTNVISFEPMFELGGGFQFVGKGAMKVFEVDDAQLAPVRSTTMLMLSRINYHLTNSSDLGVEYRWLANMLAEQVQHGALFEVAWLPVRYVAVGAGWNFSRFSDDLLAHASGDDHGFFVRATVRY